MILLSIGGVLCGVAVAVFVSLTVISNTGIVILLGVTWMVCTIAGALLCAAGIAVALMGIPLSEASL
ncbi:hypothetical protein [Rhodopirellula sp. P2]|uniref:hypothetical protein n=1 Tax=Rhodopirellula sp. P2 TaxID=2127060 RepID=UPI002368ED89|nr:hypothetical protein [Rhodopirellula sp. P2]WDQ15183.1 hypothetical protein PSR62_16225 [Rhodopirellula sp. P2]